jgi:hypothetical protein
VSDTTPTPNVPDAQAEPATPDQENWQARYVGLQKVVAKRDESLYTTQAALDALTREHAAAVTRLAEHDQQVANAGEEEAARASYEALRERFDQRPRPVGNNPARTQGGAADWTNPGKRERAEPSQGFPV